VPSAIRTKGLTKVYGDKAAVDHLDLDVAQGTVFGLLGPNGAGKTTTILMILGLSEPTSGTIRVSGLDPVRNPLDVKQIVGYMPDNVGFYETLTGRQNLRYTARLNRISDAASGPRIDELLERVGLTDAADDPAGTYSRGMRQRLGIADTLIKDPRIAILDEPTMAIDPEGVAEMQALIRGLADDHGVTVLLASHLLYQMQSICDRVGIFVAGKMVAEGTTGQLAKSLGSTSTLYEVGVAAEPDRVREALASLPAVTSITPMPRSHSWRVGVDAGQASAIVSTLVAAGLPLLHFRPMGEDLDEIYHNYFSHEEAAV
jgi:ABC-2 type transport system ATP-binding protein